MSVVESELVLTDRDMQRIATLVYERSGITLHDGKRPLVVARLQKRLRALSLDNFSQYLMFLERDRSGDELVLPNFGMETVHHVHADDIAQLVIGAIANRSVSAGEAFNAVSPQAINLKGYAEAMFRWFGREPKLSFAPYDIWKLSQTPEDAQATWEHIFRSPSHSIAKAERLLGYRPRYSSLAAVQEAVGWLIEHGQVEAARRPA